MIYLDNNATTPPDPSVLEECFAVLKQFWGNPSSTHGKGQEAMKLLTKARIETASFFNVKPEEVIFTSGATEGLNMVLRGIYAARAGHIITSNLEHEAVYQTVKALEQSGEEVAFLTPPPERGSITPEQVKSAMRPDTRLIALMWANNETGIKTDIEAIAELALNANIPLIVDAVAFIGKEELAMHPGISALCISGHKIHAAKGIGAVILRKNIPFVPQITGGPQQFGKRGGTENLPGILSLAKALSLVKNEGTQGIEKIRTLRDHFEELLLSLPNVYIHKQGKRVANVSNVCFKGIGGETLLIALDQAGIAASHGSACSSGALEPSRVLLNMGISRLDASSSIRFSLSRMTTLAEINEACSIISQLVFRFKSF